MNRFPCGDGTLRIPEEREAQYEEQREIAERARWTVPDGLRLGDDAVVCGVDQTFSDDEAVSAAVALRGGDEIERSVASAELPMPYVPGLLAYREAPAVCAALDGLAVEPDIVLLDGSGRIHPRQAGIATHVGVLRDVVSVGVAKSLLCGDPREPLDRPLREGARVPIVAGEDVEAPADAVIGCAYQSRQYDDTSGQWINPLYVSPGHGIDEETAVDAVAAQCDGRKLPEPIRRADSIVGERTA